VLRRCKNGAGAQEEQEMQRCRRCRRCRRCCAGGAEVQRCRAGAEVQMSCRVQMMSDVQVKRRIGDADVQRCGISMQKWTRRSRGWGKKNDA
jgi:hypothetical protein